MKKSLALLLLLVSATVSSQDILTVGEVFDFEVGDIFHYESSRGNEPPNATRLTVLDKAYSAGNDTVFYTMSRSYYRTDYNSGEIYSEFGTKSTFYTNLDSSILDYKHTYSYDYLSSICVAPECEFIYDTIIEERFCNILCNGFQVVFDGMGVDKYVYGRGIGVIIEHEVIESDGGDTPFVNNNLFYIKKTDCEYGTPDLTSIKQISNNHPVVYPNPTNGLIFIDVSQGKLKPHSLSVYDLNGRFIDRKVASEIEVYDVSSFPKGMYTLRIDYGEDSTWEKIVIN